MSFFAHSTHSAMRNTLPRCTWSKVHLTPALRLHSPVTFHEDRTFWYNQWYRIGSKCFENYKKCWHCPDSPHPYDPDNVSKIERCRSLHHSRVTCFPQSSTWETSDLAILGSRNKLCNGLPWVIVLSVDRTCCRLKGESRPLTADQNGIARVLRCSNRTTH